MAELTQKQQQNIKQYFDQHADVNEFFFTSDGQCFKAENDAANHGKYIAFHQGGSADVIKHTRSEVDGWKPAAVKAEKEATPEKELPPPPPETKVVTKKEVAAKAAAKKPAAKK